ncbi:MAG: ribosomal-protein-alanine N-acetyltransferase, partial [Gammaproteobacteria bacterium]|nr:ribosomal-protein-alanine N-acetyltransferase [Gammaproteobacteria bacterium]
ARRHGADTMLLEVRPSNHAALKLYADMGFNEVGIRKAYYPAAKGKEDAIILARSLIELY